MAELIYRNLQKRFHKQVLFNIEEMHLDKGKCCLLSGINGSGKTTLLKILAGLEKPDQAEVIYNNTSLNWKQYTRHCRKKVVYLHQHPVMFNSTVKENIAYGLKKSGYPAARITDCVQQAISWAQLEHVADRNARLLSGGEKQRVALARAYVLQPDYLLLDEATTNMDKVAKQRTLELICQMKEDGAGIFFTSHDQHTFGGLVDQHLVLTDGKLQSHQLTGFNTSNITSITAKLG